jgi:hypothetical protein
LGHGCLLVGSANRAGWFCGILPWHTPDPQLSSRGAVSAERKPEYIAALGEKHALA